MATTELDVLSSETASNDTVTSSEPVITARVPKRIIHFSDGVLEEYSTDEDETDDITERVDPSSMTWGPWCLYYVKGAATFSHSVADYCGERLAWLFGITTPKYRYAIAEYKRQQKEAEEYENRQKKQCEYETITSVDVQIVGGTNTSASARVDGSETYEDKY